MNPLGMLVGVALGLVIILAATVVPPIVILLSRKVKGAERLFWFVLVFAPSVLYWTNTYHAAPFPVMAAGVLLSPVVLAVFLVLKRGATKQGSASDV